MCGAKPEYSIGWSLILVLVPVFLLACSGEREPVKDFVLPEGDVVRGERLFVTYGCHGCHAIPGKEFPRAEVQSALILEIGGEVYRVRNYGELLTAIVQPDHVVSVRYKRLLMQRGEKVSGSPMPDYTAQMTVDELIDVVEFLHAQYIELHPNYFDSYYVRK